MLVRGVFKISPRVLLFNIELLSFQKSLHSLSQKARNKKETPGEIQERGAHKDRKQTHTA